MVDNRELGRYGEDAASAYLQQSGMAVLARNWRCAAGELDIVAQDRDTVVFCEVKTRSGVGYGLPAEAVSARKARRIRRLASEWLRQADRSWPAVRFDVVSVLRRRGYAPVIEHLRDVF